MTRNRALGLLVVLAVAGLAIWFLRFRGGGGGETPVAGAGSGRDGKIVATAGSGGPTETHETESATAAPRGMMPRWKLDLDPEGAERIEGQVLDPDGHGVGGAQVEISTVPPRSTTSEGDGSFAFDKLVARKFAITAQSGDLVGGPVPGRAVAGKTEQVIVHLSRGAVLAVTVTDDAKQPLADATVESGETHQFKTDAQGKALVKPSRPGVAVIAARRDGYAANTGIAVVGNDTNELAIVLHKGWPVSGRVVDEDGKPVAKAHVGVLGMFNVESADKGVETDDKGAFALAALTSGRHVLVAMDSEHAPAQSAPITVGDRAVTGIEIKMKAGGSIVGVVLGTDKNPVAYATVHAITTSASTPGYMEVARQVTADKAGAFVIRGLPRTSISVRAESSTAASKLVPLDLAKTRDVKDVQLVLDVQGGIAGVVVDDKGAPVPEVQVNAFADMWGSGGTEDSALAGMSTATTDGAGAFTIHGLPDGQYKLWAARNSATNRDWGKSGVTAKTGDKTVRITLATPGSVKGVVKIDGASAPPKGAFVQVGYQASQPANADGAFAVGELPPGQYEITFRSPEFAPLVKHDVKIEAGQVTDLGSVVVTRGRKLTGKVVDGAGNPVAGATVKVALMLFSVSGLEEQTAALDERQGIRSGVSDTDGQFTIIGLTPQATNVAADQPDQGRSTAVAVPEGKDDPAPVTLVLHGYGSIAGKVVMKGAPMGGVTVSATTKGGGAQAQFAQTADDGTFSIPKVPEGPTVLATILQKSASFKSSSTTVNVVAKQVTNVTIDIPVGTITLEVDVKPMAGAQLDAAQVFLFRGTVTAQNAKQLTDGFLGGSISGMKFWLGAGKPQPEFDELVAGPMTVCGIPITGNMNDQSFQQKLQQHVEALKVVCKPVMLAPSPDKQTFAMDLPQMAPLPND